MVATFLDFRQHFLFVDYQQKLDRQQVVFVTLEDPEYPMLLKQIKNPPFVLFYKGNKKLLDQVQNDKYIGIVGTRKITEYGRQVTESFTMDLVANDFVIVSGLALGVDALAHQTTLTSKGKTIAVLGCGIDCPYPKENASLYAQILERDGLIVSEYALGVQPTKGSFLSRNRIIAGLSQGIVVTEGASQSGSLTTARHTFANGRKVFAVPGQIYSQLSAGPYQLISQGATLATSAKDILQTLGVSSGIVLQKRKGEIPRGETHEEQQIIDLLARETLGFDELVKRTTIEAADLGMILSFLEMKELLVKDNEGLYCLRS